MAVAIVDISGRKWVGGLTWRSFEARPNSQEIRAEAADLDADWVAHRVGPDAIQAGFGAKPESTKSAAGLCSMAAAVAAQQQQPWLGIYQISDDQWWFLAVRDGHAILPYGDVIGTRTEIEDARERYSGFADWNFVEGSAQDLGTLLSEAGRKSAKVYAVDAPPRWLMPAAVVVVVAAALAGGAAWWSHVEADRAEQARLEQLARDNAARALQAVAKQLSILESMPAPDEWLASCRQTVSTLPVSIGGWQLATYECAGNAAHVVWRRGPGATPAASPPGDIESGGGEIKQTITLASSRDGTNNAVPLREAEAKLYSLLLPIGAHVTVVKRAADPHLPGSPVSKPLMLSEAFQVGLPIAPYSVRWSGVPGLVLENATATGNGAWTVTGTIYGH